MAEQEHVKQTLSDVLANVSYFYHLIADKPAMVAIGAIFSAAVGKFTAALPDHMLGVSALIMLVFIDWLTKRHACKVKGVPFTSEVMRKKGILKLRDYIFFYIAAACTIPLVGDLTIYRGAVTFMAVVELWSVAENLNDSGNLEFDIRQISIFDGVRTLLAGGVFKAPEPQAPPFGQVNFDPANPFGLPPAAAPDSPATPATPPQAGPID